MAAGYHHYQEAERLLSAASKLTRPDGPPVNPEAAAHLATLAQVHATLALAAATALNDGAEGLLPEDWEMWRDAAGVRS